MATAHKPPRVSKSSVDRAGEDIRAYMNVDDDAEAEELLAAAAAGWGRAQAWRSSLAYPLALVTPGVRNWVGQESAQMIVAQRLKRMPQIVSKLRRFPSMRLSQMEDIAGCRAVVANNAEVEAVGKRIERKWRVRYTSDYRQDGKPGTGYRALHFVVIRRERLVEVQLRTNGQHNWAEVIERTASRTGFDLKDGQGPAELIEYFRAASDVIWAQENGLDVDAGLMEEFENLRAQARPYFRATKRQRARRRDG